MRFPGLRTSLFAALALCTTPAAAAAQTGSAGAVFPLFGTDALCESSTFGAFQVGYEAPISGSIDGQVEAYYAPNGSYPWPWHPIGGSGEAGGSQVPTVYDHEGGFRLAVNLLVPIIGDQYQRFGLKLLGGFGARRLGASQYSAGGDGEPEQFGVDSQLAPLLTGGLVADIDLTDRLGLRLQGRGNAIFSGELQLRGATSAQDRLVAGDTQVFAQAMAGITVKLGDRR